VNELAGSGGVIDHGTSRTGRWLHAKRFRISLWIAAAEAIVVLFSHDVTRYTVIAVAVVAALVWLGGRESRFHIVRQIVWIFAASQFLAVIAVILAWIVKWAVILAVVAFAIIGLAFLFLDRR
jgi:hypothetical protein